MTRKQINSIFTEEVAFVVSPEEVTVSNPIEAGFAYAMRNGEISGIIKELDSEIGFMGEKFADTRSGLSYFPDGRFLSSPNHESPYDLVKKVEKETYTTTSDGKTEKTAD